MAIVWNTLFYVLLAMSVLSVGIALFSIKDRKKSEELYLRFSVFTTFGIYTSGLFILNLLVGMQVVNKPIHSNYMEWIPVLSFFGMGVLKVWGLADSIPKTELKAKNP